jgi:hypothetical protein
VRSYSFFIEDIRYSVPTLKFVTVKDLARARELAVYELAASPSHVCVEVFEGEQPLFRLDRPDRTDITSEQLRKPPRRTVNSAANDHAGVRLKT